MQHVVRSSLSSSSSSSSSRSSHRWSVVSAEQILDGVGVGAVASSRGVPETVADATAETVSASAKVTSDVVCGNTAVLDSLVGTDCESEG